MNLQDEYSNDVTYDRVSERAVAVQFAKVSPFVGHRSESYALVLVCRTQLRNKFKLNGCVYRVFPNGEVQYLHPKDGVYPEKVNAGRVAVNTNSRRIGANVNPIAVRPSVLTGHFTSFYDMTQSMTHGLE